MNSSEVDEPREIRNEIMEFEQDFPDCPYKIIDKIGTFSSVYIAEDINHYKYDNSAWCTRHIPEETKDRNATCGKVALKRIYATSSAVRIHTELGLLHCLRNHENIAGLITAIRHEDQIVAVLPYFEHDNFKSYFRKMSRSQTQNYLRCLLKALSHVHSYNFIHRDIKPSNFLYNVSLNTGVLIDFGLAQKQPDPVEVRSTKKQLRTAQLAPTKLGYLINDSRPSYRASRAGTRGFRAPEVLFKVTLQTEAIDIWSVGVTFLCIMTGQFPFFQSNNDDEALIEITSIFGKRAMEELAVKLNRKFATNIPDLADPIPLRKVVSEMAPHMIKIVGNEGLELLESLMTLDPKERITAKEALRSSFLDERNSQ